MRSASRSLVAPDAGCCGAIRLHLGYNDEALDDMRANIDAWWPYVEQGVEAIVMNASGCGATVKEYAHLLRHDPAYAEKARRIVELTRDLAEILPEFEEALVALARRRVDAYRRVSSAVHAAAWPADARQGRASADRARRRSAPARRQPSVLRLGRHVFGDCSPKLSYALRDQKLERAARRRSRR